MWKTSGAREGGPGRSGGRVEGVECVSICKDVVDLIVKCTDCGQQEEEEQGHDRDVSFFFVRDQICHKKCQHHMRI